MAEPEQLGRGWEPGAPGPARIWSVGAGRARHTAGTSSQKSTLFMDCIRQFRSNGLG